MNRPDLRLKDSGKGTVVHRSGGPIWQKCSGGMRLRKGACKGRARLMSWYEAKHYCRKLSLINHRWRLPTIQELARIGDGSGRRPQINLTLFPGIYPYEYWSGTQYLSVDGYLKQVFSYRGRHAIGVLRRGSRYLVRCIARMAN